MLVARPSGRGALAGPRISSPGRAPGGFEFPARQYGCRWRATAGTDTMDRQLWPSLTQSRQVPPSLDRIPASKVAELRVVIIEDSKVILDRLDDSLAVIRNVEIVGLADNEPDAVLLLRNLRWNVALVDLQLKSGTGIGMLKALGESAADDRHRVIVFTNFAYPVRGALPRAGRRTFFRQVAPMELAPGTHDEAGGRRRQRCLIVGGCRRHAFGVSRGGRVAATRLRVRRPASSRAPRTMRATPRRAATAGRDGGRIPLCARAKAAGARRGVMAKMLAPVERGNGTRRICEAGRRPHARTRWI